jgi:hypothetical protein
MITLELPVHRCLVISFEKISYPEKLGQCKILKSPIALRSQHRLKLSSGEECRVLGGAFWAPLLKMLFFKRSLHGVWLSQRKKSGYEVPLRSLPTKRPSYVLPSTKRPPSAVLKTIRECPHYSYLKRNACSPITVSWESLLKNVNYVITTVNV